MLDKTLLELGLADLERLVTNAVPEGRRLDYKRDLPGPNDEQRKEFLADISSFANANGGDLLFGVAERDGVASEIVGCDVTNLDAEALRLQSILLDGLSPRVPGLQWHWVPGAARGPVLVVRIPRSWVGPHMIAFKKSGRFFSRSASGRSQLDLPEIRSAFLSAFDSESGVRNFVAERVGRLISGDAPVPLSSGQLVCIHLVPLWSMRDAGSIDLLVAANSELARPLGTSSTSWRFNIDGLLRYSPSDGRGNLSYLQVFRSGALETTHSSLVVPGNAERAAGIPAGAFARDVREFLQRMVEVFRQLNVPAPISVHVTLVGAKEAVLYVHHRHSVYHASGTFGREVVMFPELLLETLDMPITFESIRPILDILWQAAGFPRCLDFADDGIWRPAS